MTKSVLFLCTGNACRSQMAEGWARAMFPGLRVESAGVDPHGVDPLSVKAMAEVGIDISNHRSKHVEEFFGQAFDLVVTVCDRAQENCPNFPGPGKKIHHNFPDPPKLAKEMGGDAITAYAQVRDKIKNFLATCPDLKA